MTSSTLSLNEVHRAWSKLDHQPKIFSRGDNFSGVRGDEKFLMTMLTFGYFHDIFSRLQLRESDRECDKEDNEIRLDQRGDV